ncbi:HAMP domain-containing sensor histidine kinase [Spirobacillus cienkowskii]|uniref:HAMP domain-containing sensor histidine kinase n=1 Tax=Spirobacillus cienkowskii TaxID=495820 RepID=UPI0030CF2BD8
MQCNFFENIFYRYNLYFLLALILVFIIILLYNLKIYKKIILEKNDKKLTEIEFSLNDLSSHISHEFRKPFNLLKMYLNKPAAAKNPNFDIESYNSMVLNKLDQTVKHVDVLLENFTQLGVNDELDHKILEVKPIIENLLHELSHTSNIPIYKINTKYNHTYKFKGDIFKINQAIRKILLYKFKNLNNNNFWIRTNNTIIENQKYISISIGVDEFYVPITEINKIFNVFYCNKTKGNSNLDLVLSKKIINSHSGDLICQIIPNEGTEFIINLPIYK